MCWSGEASLALAAAGAATTAYVAWRKESALLWMPLGYFTLMELLQAYTYTVIDQCGTPANEIATLLGYLHICFQPFFVNMICLHFVPFYVRRAVLPWAMVFSFGSAIFMLIQMYPFDASGHCTAYRGLCGDILCSISGEWHIAWLLPLNHFFEQNEFWSFMPGLPYPTYTFTALILPIIYGSWRLTFFHFVFGPLLASTTTSSSNEEAAIWCLLAIAILMVVVKTPVRELMYVYSWPLWRILPGHPSKKPGYRVIQVESRATGSSK